MMYMRICMWTGCEAPASKKSVWECHMVSPCGRGAATGLSHGEQVSASLSLSHFTCVPPQPQEDDGRIVSETHLPLHR